MSDLTTLRLRVGVQGRLIAMLSLRRVRQTFDAANLLAHQQARGIEAREEEAQGAKDYLDLRDHADALAVEVATLRKQLEEREGGMHLRIRLGYDKTVADSWRAANERLKALLTRVLDAWTWEANQGDGIDERHGDLWSLARYAASGICAHGREDMSRCRTCEQGLAALGEEVREPNPAEPFCACGRVVSMCDGSRAGCGKGPDRCAHGIARSRCVACRRPLRREGGAA